MAAGRRGIAWLCTLLAGLCAGLPGCGTSSEEVRDAATADSVRVGIQANAASALILIAQEAGLFAREGLRVELVPYPSGKMALAGMLRGEVDLATAADVAIVIASFERRDFRVLSTLAVTDQAIWILARRDHGILTPADLRGRRIGTQESSAVHYFLSMFLQNHDLSEEEVEIVFLAPEELPGALIAGRVDAISMRDPFLADAARALAGSTVEFREPQSYRQLLNLTARHELIEQHPDRVRRVLRVLAAAAGLARRDPLEATRLTARGLGANEEEIRADWDDYEFGLSLSQTLLRTLEAEAGWAMDRRLVPAGPLPDFRELMDPGLLEQVSPSTVTMIH
jgi:ABC-type nitrate/sulfonate/bicarbonate transport system substrate-binding protein